MYLWPRITVSPDRQVFLCQFLQDFGNSPTKVFLVHPHLWSDQKFVPCAESVVLQEKCWRCPDLILPLHLPKDKLWFDLSSTPFYENPWHGYRKYPRIMRTFSTKILTYLVVTEERSSHKGVLLKITGLGGSSGVSLGSVKLSTSLSGFIQPVCTEDLYVSLPCVVINVKKFLSPSNGSSFLCGPCCFTDTQRQLALLLVLRKWVALRKPVRHKWKELLRVALLTTSTLTPYLTPYPILVHQGKGTEYPR